jgi:hypothetical protein
MLSERVGLFDQRTEELDAAEVQSTRFLLDRLFTDSQLYTQSTDYKELLDFVARLPNFAPFNAMLLQIQKPGLRFAASAYDWRVRFERFPKEGARPLLILWPFGPVALVYDELDTLGKELPRDVRSFYAQGAIDHKRIEVFHTLMGSKGISSEMIDAGDRHAGSIRRVRGPLPPNGYSGYLMFINRNHEAPIQFVTIAHELAHLFLGHLGADSKLHIPDRRGLSHQQVELEAESVAYMVCERNGVTSASETYLKDFVKNNTTIDALDVYQVMRAAGQVEVMLNLSRTSRFIESTAGR